MYLFITATVGANAGPFNIYSNVDGYLSAFETGITAAQLTAGFFTANAPSGTTTVKLYSVGACTNATFVPVSGVTTTTTISTTTTTTTFPPMVLMVQSPCCGDFTQHFVLYDPFNVPAYNQIGDVFASNTFGPMVAYEVNSGPMPGLPDVTSYDGLLYGVSGDCSFFFNVFGPPGGGVCYF